jgi:hypothetical protein
VQARVRWLEADGTIQGYRALVDPEALGLPLAALIAISTTTTSTTFPTGSRTVVLQTFFENRAHPVVGPDDKEPADRASPSWLHRSSSVCAGSILVRSGHVRVCLRCRN